MTADVTADEVPTLLAAEINALPARVRAYIHHLESDADPAGDKWRLAYLEETNAALKAAMSTHDAAHGGGGGGRLRKRRWMGRVGCYYMTMMLALTLGTTRPTSCPMISRLPTGCPCLPRPRAGGDPVNGGLVSDEGRR